MRFSLIDTLNIVPPWPVALLLYLVLLLLAYVATVGLFVESDRRPHLAEAVAATVFGLALLGFLLLFVRFASLPSSLVTLVLVTVAAASVYRRRGALFPTFKVQSSVSWMSIAVASLFILPTLIGGVMMGLGDFPKIFLNADTPYRLTHVYQLIEDRGMPPLSLSNLDIRYGYHYGGPAVVAVVHLVTGMTVPSAFFLTIVIASCGIVAAALSLAASLRGQLPLAPAFGLILVAAPMSVWQIGNSVHNWASDPQLFLNHYPDLTVYLGIFLFLLVLNACLDLRDRRRILLTFLVTVVMAAAKSSYFASAGLLVFSAALIQMYRSRDLRWLLLPVAVFVVGLTTTRVTGSSVTAVLELKPFFLFNEFGKHAFKHSLDLLLFLLPAIVYMWAAGGWSKPRHEQQDRLLILGLTVVGLYVFFNLFGGDVIGLDGELVPNKNFLEPFRMLPKLLAVAAILALAAVWDPTRRRSNLVVAIYFSIVVALPLAHRTTHALTFLIWPDAGHEYVNNEAIAEALAHIPVVESVIVTNDLRYPANGFKRDQRQMQIPALFGHQAYAANTFYEPYPDAARRVALQQSLAADSWDTNSNLIAREQGWTHLLIHKLAPHPREIPLVKVFENQRYSVYTFD